MAERLDRAYGLSCEVNEMDVAVGVGSLDEIAGFAAEAVRGVSADA
jgi:CRISPR system Cascade subunit CasC